MGTKRQRRTVGAAFAAFKARVVREVLTGQQPAAQGWREQQLKPDRLSRWKADCLTHASSVFAGDEREQQAERRIAELERLVGRRSLELAVAKKLPCSRAGAEAGCDGALAWGLAAHRELPGPAPAARRRLWA